MSLVRPKPPKQAYQALHAALKPLASEPELWAASPLADVRLQDVAAIAPHRCYRLGCKDVVAGRLVESARPRAWQFLLAAKQKIIGVAELLQVGQRLVFHALDCGPLASALEQAYVSANQYAVQNTGQFEVRVIEAASLGQVALWLQRPRADLFVPLAMPGSPPPPDRPVDQAALLVSWQASAKRVIAFHQQFLQEKQDAGQRTPKKTKAAQSRG